MSTEPIIKYEGFGGGPLLVGGLGPGPPGPPLNPALADHTLSIGSMFVECQHCRAKKFNGETPAMCCAKGKVFLPPLAAAPEPLASLLTGTHVDSREGFSGERYAL